VWLGFACISKVFSLALCKSLDNDALMTSTADPILAPPGAGLPAPEHFIARRLFALRRLTGNRDAFDARFRTERAGIRRLVDSCPPASRGIRVLIARPRGLEDSSRYWSVWMTLDHLRITNEAFAGIIRSLTSGRVPPGVASTAAVKPSPSADGSVEPLYEASCDAVREAAFAAPDLRTPLRFAHPWFGPLDAFGWHALSGTHLGIHRVQIRRILAGL